jgi:hypothetical protein
MPGMAGDAGAIDQEDEGRGGAIEDRHLRPIDRDDRIIDAAASQRRHHMFDRGKPGGRIGGTAKRGAKTGIYDLIKGRRDFDTRVSPAEPDAGAGGSGQQGQFRWAAAV